jgi:hypothetical protein
MLAMDKDPSSLRPGRGQIMERGIEGFFPNGSSLL